MSDYTEDDYYRFVVASLEEDENPIIDHVGTTREWTRCKAALLRWIAEKDDEYDNLARTLEHE